MKTIFSLLIGCLLCAAVAAQELTVGSYNIRYKNDTDSINGNGWHRRCKPMCDQILWERPDIFGTQEVLHDQLLDLEKGLGIYRWIGVGRDDGKEEGEYAAIFYNPGRVELVESGNFWLNETPDRPALGWDAACIRICTWGHFRDLQTKKEFYFLNLHMDHVGKIARREAAKLVMERITKMTDGGKKLAVLTGDFNVDQNDETYSIFTKSGLLCDAYVKAERRFAENGTFNEFNTELYTESRIDHIFVSPSFRVKNFGVLTNAYWTGCNTPSEEHKAFDAPQEISFRKYVRRTPSDHYPVFARIVR